MGSHLVWAACLSVIAGIFVRSLVAFPFPLVFGIFLCGTVCLCVGLASRSKHWRRFVLTAIALIFFALGVMRMEVGIVHRDTVLNALIGQRVEFDGVIVGEPDVREGSVRIPVQVSTLASSSAQVHANVLVIVQGRSFVSYGDHVHVSGKLELPKAFDAGSGRQFNYPGYLAKDGILYEMSFASLEKIDGWSGDLFSAGAIDLKHIFVRGLEATLPEPQSGLAAGITAGDKRGLGAELSQDFKTVSLVHVVVLSGYNITVVIDALFRWLVGVPYLLRYGLGGTVALFFALMTGGAAASVRAALMAIIAMTAKSQGRIYRADRALAVVAAGMALWNPYVVVFDPGYQLSILATLGLIFLSPIVERWFTWAPSFGGLREIAVSTTSAQIAVLPLLLYETGQLSLVAFPANLLALAAIPYAMSWSAIAAVAGMLLGSAGTLVALPAYLLLSYVLFVAHTLAHVPFAAVLLPAFSAWLLLPVYASLGLWVYRSQSIGDNKKSP